MDARERLRERFFFMRRFIINANQFYSTKINFFIVQYPDTDIFYGGECFVNVFQKIFMVAGHKINATRRSQGPQGLNDLRHLTPYAVVEGTTNKNRLRSERLDLPHYFCHKVGAPHMP